MKRLLLLFVISFCFFQLAAPLCSASFVDALKDQADFYAVGLGEGATSATNNPIALRIGMIMGVAFIAVGILFVLIFIYAGWLWMSAQGDKNEIKKAKDWMVNSVIGLIIMTSAYTISNYIVNKLVDVAKPIQGPTGIYDVGQACVDGCREKARVDARKDCNNESACIQAKLPAAYAKCDSKCIDTGTPANLDWAWD